MHAAFLAETGDLTGAQKVLTESMLYGGGGPESADIRDDVALHLVLFIDSVFFEPEPEFPPLFITHWRQHRDVTLVSHKRSDELHKAMSDRKFFIGAWSRFPDGGVVIADAQIRLPAVGRQ